MFNTKLIQPFLQVKISGKKPFLTKKQLKQQYGSRTVLRLIEISCRKRNRFLSKVRFLIQKLLCNFYNLCNLILLDASFYLSLLNQKINLMARFKTQDNHFCQHLVTFINWNKLLATFVDILEILYQVFILEMKTFLCLGKMKFW